MVRTFFRNFFSNFPQIQKFTSVSGITVLNWISWVKCFGSDTLTWWGRQNNSSLGTIYWCLNHLLHNLMLSSFKHTIKLCLELLSCEPSVNSETSPLELSWLWVCQTFSCQFVPVFMYLLMAKEIVLNDTLTFFAISLWRLHF